MAFCSKKPPQKLITKKLYIAFYKPYGVLSQFTPESGHLALDSFNFPKEVYPAGRLDHDSEGLLLLTNDGKFIKKFLDPKNGHPRTYLVQVEGQITIDAIKQLENGVMIKNYQTKPCHAKIVEKEPNLPPRNPPIRFRKNIPTSWLEINLCEGKNRQVRHMTAKVGFPTLRLIRIKMGNLDIKTLKEGEWKYIDLKEIIG